MSADILENLLLRAAEEDDTAIAPFYEILLESSLIVLDRYQAAPLAHQPSYPHELTTLLGVQDQERVVVPAFSSKERYSEWCPQDLAVHTVAFSDILERIPEGWWLVLNPGSDWQKEISPWEVTQLRGGKASIPALLEELKASETVTTVEITALPVEEQQRLKEELSKQAAQISSIQRLFLAREIGKDIEEKELTSLLLGVEVLPSNEIQPEQIAEQLRAIADPLLIGSFPLKIRTGIDARSGILLGIFGGMSPFYERATPGFGETVKKIFGLNSAKAK